MSKPVAVKKTLIRNPVQSVPKIVPSKEGTPNKSEIGSAPSSSSKVSHSKTSQKITFNVPDIHSTLKISKKIDEIVCPRKTRSIPELNNCKLAVDEKVTRKVNFPYGKTVFKDLIPLIDSEVKVQPSNVRSDQRSDRDPTYQKDKEPVLSDFLRPRTQKIHYHKPKSSLSYLDEKKMNIATANGLDLYKVLYVNETFL